jgi:hypothetical protein
LPGKLPNGFKINWTVVFHGFFLGRSLDSVNIYVQPGVGVDTRTVWVEQ